MARVRYATAITFSPEVERAVDGIRAVLGSPSIGRIQPHITLIPPGEATPDELGTLLWELAGVASTMGPFELRLGGLDVFLNRRTIGYLRVEDVEGVLHSLGAKLQRGHREFVPHVTVAESAPLDLLNQISRASREMSLEARAERISLLLADLRDPKRRWRPLVAARFGYGGRRIRSGIECRVMAVEGWEEGVPSRRPSTAVLALHQERGVLAEAVAHDIGRGFHEIVRVRVFDPDDRGFGLGGLVLSELLELVGTAVAADSPFFRRYLLEEVSTALASAIGLGPVAGWVMRSR